MLCAVCCDRRPIIPTSTIHEYVESICVETDPKRFRMGLNLWYPQCSSSFLYEFSLAKMNSPTSHPYAANILLLLVVER